MPVSVALSRAAPARGQSKSRPARQQRLPVGGAVEVYPDQTSLFGDDVAGSSASLSGDGVYRWSLTRRWAAGEMVTWVMLNPSTADAATDDPTIRRCAGFAKAWGFSGLVVVNLYALRATNPAALWRHPDPIGAGNDSIIAAAAAASATVVAAWGANAPRERADAVSALLMAAHRAGDRCGRRRLLALGHTKSGAPRHPLYVRADASPVALERRSIL